MSQFVLSVLVLCSGKPCETKPVPVCPVVQGEIPAGATPCTLKGNLVTVDSRRKVLRISVD